MKQRIRTMAGAGAPLGLAGVLFGLLLLLPPVAAAEKGCRAIHGDTLQCGRERIRVEGVETPEKGQRGYEAAKERLRQLTEGKNVRIERKARDKYGRTVAKVTVNGEDVGKRLKREGHVKPRPPQKAPRKLGPGAPGNRGEGGRVYPNPFAPPAAPR